MMTRWIEASEPPNISITQVYGYCFDKHGRLLLIKDGKKFTLPGGKPEPGESIEDTLQREVLEEVQTVIEDIFLLGYHYVEEDTPWFNGSPYAQLRMIARIKMMLPGAIDPAEGRQYERLLYTPEDTLNALQWGESGEAQIYGACRLAKIRLSFDIF